MKYDEMEQRRKAYGLIKLSMLIAIPVIAAALFTVMDPPWMGLVIGGIVAVGDLMALGFLKKQWGIGGTPTSSQSQADEKQSEQL